MNRDKIDVILSEYREMYEYARHEDRVAQTKEHVFGAVAFTIFAYSNINFSNIVFLVIAAFSSIGIWIYHVVSIELMGLYYTTRFKRIREIEEKLNATAGEPLVEYQLRYQEYRQDIIDKIRSESDPSQKILEMEFLFKPLRIATLTRGIQPVRRITTLFLIGLWTLSIGAHAWLEDDNAPAITALEQSRPATTKSPAEKPMKQPTKPLDKPKKPMPKIPSSSSILNKR